MARIVFQVAHALNCPTTNDRELAGCLRNQDIDTLLRVKIHKPKYVPAYAPLIDHAVIPDKPFNLMENVQLFGRYDLEVPSAERCWEQCCLARSFPHIDFVISNGVC